MLQIVRRYSMDEFRHTGVLPAAVCLLVREVGFLSITSILQYHSEVCFIGSITMQEIV